MSDDLRTTAEQNLADAAARLGLADPRVGYRNRLRALRDADPDAFTAASRHYAEIVIPAMAAADADALDVWIRYGTRLTAPGRILAIDATGRAERYAAPLAPGALVVHIPDDNSAPAIIAAAPAALSPAQQAAVDLLVQGSLGLPR